MSCKLISDQWYVISEDVIFFEAVVMSGLILTSPDRVYAGVSEYNIHIIMWNIKHVIDFRMLCLRKTWTDGGHFENLH